MKNVQLVTMFLLPATFRVELETDELLEQHKQPVRYKFTKFKFSVLFCSFGQGSSLLWTHMLRPFYKQAHCASTGRTGAWLMMCARVCMTEGKEGLSRREQLCQVLDNATLLGVAYCLTSARLTDACYSASVSGPSYIYQLRSTSA